MGCVIGGSFHKAFKEIQRTRDYFVRHGIYVIAPKKSKLINPKAEFPLLETDNKKLKPWEIENRFLEDILRAEFYYIVNPKGYIGRTVSYEIGWAVGNGIPVYCSRKFKKSKSGSPDDAIIEAMLKYSNPIGRDYVKSPKDIVKLLKE